MHFRTQSFVVCVGVSVCVCVWVSVCGRMSALLKHVLCIESTHTRVQQWATVAADDGAGGGTSALNSCNFTCTCRQEHVAATGCLASVRVCVCL